MNMIKVSPRDDPEGTIWDEKGRDQLAGIYVFYDKHSVHGLQFLFYENGSVVMSNIHGTVYRYNFSAIVFDYPSEFLTSINCTVRESCTLQLTSIKFGTNKGNSYGPFGTPSTDDDFYKYDYNFHIGNHLLFGGFHGTQSCLGIGTIGVYLKKYPTFNDQFERYTRVKHEKEED